jgi:ABC-type bacteriocin/lantibiotic exporter with double-glycine peptidase domain
MENQSLAIVGQSGAGKSTLVDIILGILSPQHGEVAINSLDPTSAISIWRNQIVYIPQETMLLSKSIAENIAFGVPENEIDLQKIWKSLEVVQLSEFVMTLPNQLDTQIGETGIKLSGGQKQRIGLSRAVYLEPKILFLDEATSALDAITESQISSTIQEIAKKSTVVVIAHRLSTVKSVDRVLYLENGKPGVFGTFDEVSFRSEGFAAQTNLF